jgi:hypothetical protein
MWSLIREVSNGLSVRLAPVLVPLSEGLWLRDLAGGTIDLYHSSMDLNRTSLGPFFGSCASPLPCAASDSFCPFRLIRIQIAF